jgi:hypothetical protein
VTDHLTLITYPEHASHSERPNVALLVKALRYVTARPDLWTQAAYLMDVRAHGYREGPAACLGGRVVLLAGALPIWSRDARTTARASYSIAGEVRAWSVPTLASRILGVPTGLGDQLFAAERTLRELWELSAQWAADHGPTPVPVPDRLPSWANQRQPSERIGERWWSPAARWLADNDERKRDRDGD